MAKELFTAKDLTAEDCLELANLLLIIRDADLRINATQMEDYGFEDNDDFVAYTREISRKILDKIGVTGFAE